MNYGNNAINGNQPAASSERTPEVIGMAGRIDARVSDLRDSIDHLEKRMEAVVRSSPPVTSGNAIPREVPGTALGSPLCNICEAVESLGARVRDLTARLEV